MGVFRKDKKSRKARVFEAPTSTVRMASRSYYRSSTARTQNSTTSTQQKPVKPTKDNARKNIKITFASVVNVLLLLSFIAIGVLATTLSNKVDVLVPEDAFVYRDPVEYESFAQELIQKSITNRSKLLFRSEQFETAFAERFPEVRQVEAIIPIGGRDLTVAVGLSEPLAYVINGSSYAIVDASGIVATFIEDSVSVKDDIPTIKLLERQEKFTVGARVLTLNEVQLIRLIESEFAEYTLSDTANTALATADYSLSIARGRLEVSFEKVPYYARFNTFGNSEEQVGKLKATLAKLSREGTLPATYVDLRVEGRVFVL